MPTLRRRRKTTKKNPRTDESGAGYDLALAAAVHALSPNPPRHSLSTDIALAVDGRLYVSAEFLTKDERRGRKRFVGFQLTRREQIAAIREARAMTINLSPAIRKAMREERARPPRKLAAKASPTT